MTTRLTEAEYADFEKGRMLQTTRQPKSVNSPSRSLRETDRVDRIDPRETPFPSEQSEYQPVIPIAPRIEKLKRAGSCDARLVSAAGRVRNLVFDAPIKTVSEANRSSREPWQVKMRRRKEQQEAMAVMLLNALRGRTVEMPCVVKMTRVGPKRMDSDNLAGSFKACRDQIAKQLGVDDGDPRIRFEYDQTPIGERSYNVIVEIHTIDTSPKPIRSETESLPERCPDCHLVYVEDSDEVCSKRKEHA